MQQLISTPILFSGRPGIESEPRDWLLVTEICSISLSRQMLEHHKKRGGVPTLNTLSVSPFTVIIVVDAM